MEKYINVTDLSDKIKELNNDDWYLEGLVGTDELYELVRTLPAADVVEEENILKFYYVRSIDEYWIGQRIDNFYYAEYDPKNRQWVWTHSRYLPWGKHIVAPDTLWKEHTYPSEPEEMPFGEWLTGFIKKHIANEARQKLDEAYKKLPAKDADVPGKWISTKDRLPECEPGAEVGNITFRLKSGTIYTGCFGRCGLQRDKYFRNWTDSGEGWDAEYVTHWVMLSDPEEVENDG